MMRRWILVGLALAGGLAWAPAAEAQITLTVRSGAAADVAGITPIRDQFRTDLGGGTTAGPAGLFDDGVRQRREINWDAVPLAFSAPSNNLPANFFNVNSPRGAIFETVGSSTAFRVSANAADGAVNFGEIDASYSTAFLQFSPQKLFVALDGTQMDVRFFVPGTTTPAGVSGFGVIFTDVEAPDTTTIQFFGPNDESLGTFAAPAQPGETGFSFLGAFVDSGFSIITRVRITSGNTALGAGVTDGGAARDLVVMDDFIYGNPVAVPEPTTMSLVGMAAASAWLRRRKSKQCGSDSPRVSETPLAISHRRRSAAFRVVTRQSCS